MHKSQLSKFIHSGTLLGSMSLHPTRLDHVNSPPMLPHLHGFSLAEMHEMYRSEITATVILFKYSRQNLLSGGISLCWVSCCNLQLLFENDVSQGRHWMKKFSWMIDSYLNSYFLEWRLEYFMLPCLFSFGLFKSFNFVSRINSSVLCSTCNKIPFLFLSFTRVSHSLLLP